MSCMLITYESNEDGISFSEVETGEVFRMTGNPTPFMKTDEGDCNSINLETGILVYFSSDIKVVKLTAELKIKDEIKKEKNKK